MASGCHDRCRRRKCQRRPRTDPSLPGGFEGTRGSGFTRQRQLTPGIPEGCVTRCDGARASLSAELRTACDNVGSRTPHSPRIPHDKVGEMTDFGHKALPEGHRHPRAESFKSSLGHCTNVALTRVNSQSHGRSRGLAQHPHNIAGSSCALVGRCGQRDTTGPPRLRPQAHATRGIRCAGAGISGL